MNIPNMNLNSFFTQTIPEMTSKMAVSNFPMGSTHLVQITHINHPHSFYVRLACVRYSAKLLENRGEPLPVTKLQTGAEVVYESRTVGRCVRGRIQKLDECERGLGLVCTILAIDYGCVDKHVFARHVYHALEETLDCPPLALHCQLNKCEPRDDVFFDSEAIHGMKFFSEKYTSKIIIRNKAAETYKVDLKTLGCPDDISTILAMLGFTTFFRDDDFQVIVKPRPPRYIHRVLKAGDILHVRVQHGQSPLGFYAAEIEEYKHYDNVVHWYKFTSYCMNQPDLMNVEAAVDGRTCAVKVPNPTRYERAIVMKANAQMGKALVQLVDSGKEMEANFKDLKPVGGEFNKCPPMALFCTAERQHSLNFVFGLRPFTAGLEFIIKVLQPGNGFRLPHRVKLLKALPATTLPGEIYVEEKN